MKTSHLKTYLDAIRVNPNNALASVQSCSHSVRNQEDVKAVHALADRFDQDTNQRTFFAFSVGLVPARNLYEADQEIKKKLRPKNPLGNKGGRHS